MKQKTIFKTIFICAALCFATLFLMSPNTAFADSETGHTEQQETELALRAPEHQRCKRGPRGVPGQTGPQGPRGHRGKKGHKGDTGDQGPAGQAGTPGTPGEQGIPGTPGEAGAPGTPGEAGPAGTPGEQGIPGTPGEQGPAGTPGAAGTPGTPGTPGEQGEQGPPGENGSITQNAVSYYTQSGQPALINPGQSTISFASQNTRLGNNITVSGSTITVLTNGTYLISVSGIVQEFIGEAQPGILDFTIGLQEEHEGEYPWIDVQPTALTAYSAKSADEGGYYMTAPFSVLQMVRVNDAPQVFNVRFNNGSGTSVDLYSPILNMMQID